MSTPPGASWIRRDFTAAGLTQYPTGRHLSAIQDQLGGSVVLCIDVSGSMSGSPLKQAVAGARRFVGEALDQHYSVGIILWDTGVAAQIALQRDAKALGRFLSQAAIAGGTDVFAALVTAENLLSGRPGDLVVAVFGDGDLGNRHRAITQADAMRRKNIRIVTCGLGAASARSLDEISTEREAAPRTAAPDSIADAVAGLATGLRRGGAG